MQSNIPPKPEPELVTLPKTTVIGLLENIMTLLNGIDKLNTVFVKNSKIAEDLH